MHRSLTRHSLSTTYAYLPSYNITGIDNNEEWFEYSVRIHRQTWFIQAINAQASFHAHWLISIFCSAVGNSWWETGENNMFTKFATFDNIYQLMWWINVNLSDRDCNCIATLITYMCAKHWEPFCSVECCQLPLKTLSSVFWVFKRNWYW